MDDGCTSTGIAWIARQSAMLRSRSSCRVINGSEEDLQNVISAKTGQFQRVRNWQMSAIQLNGIHSYTMRWRQNEGCCIKVGDVSDGQRRQGTVAVSGCGDTKRQGCKRDLHLMGRSDIAKDVRIGRANRNTVQQNVIHSVAQVRQPVEHQRIPIENADAIMPNGRTADDFQVAAGTMNGTHKVTLTRKSGRNRMVCIHLRESVDVALMIHLTQCNTIHPNRINQVAGRGNDGKGNIISQLHRHAA